MRTRIQKWDNSHGLRLTRQLLQKAGLAVGDVVEVGVQDGKIVVTLARQVRGKCSLDDLLAQIPEGYKPEEVDWGPSVGREVW